jgi:hypothetical protein
MGTGGLLALDGRRLDDRPPLLDRVRLSFGSDARPGIKAGAGATLAVPPIRASRLVPA